MAAHTHAVAENGAARDRARGIDGGDGDARAADAQGGDIGVDQRRFAGPGCTGEADHRRPADARTNASMNEIRGGAATFHQRDAARQRRGIARREPVEKIVMHRTGSPLGDGSDDDKGMTEAQLFV